MNKNIIIEEICKAIKKVRETKPLIEQVTNYVTINDCANVTLAIGASPVMGDAYDEVDQMTKIANALVLNFGIISSESLKTMIKAGKTANENNIPIVFDPVGIGATPFRNETVIEFLNQVHVSIIKGNASEIMALAGVNVKTKGVDSSVESTEAIDAAIFIARKYRCVCTVTGKVDIITDGINIIKIQNESDSLAYITGTGCMIASLIGSYVGANKNPLISSVAGVLTMSLSGEIANNETKGIAAYKEEVMNNIFNFNPEMVIKNAKISYEKVKYQYDMYVITDEKACLGKDLYTSIEECIKGGAKIIQLREKKLATRDFLNRAIKIKEICAKYNVPLLINDRLDIAIAVDADGVHVGQSDMPIKKVKELMGHNKIVGVSVKTVSQALEAQKEGADYIGVGAIFATNTKPDAHVISKETIMDIKNNVYIPILAIGGIKLENLDVIKDIGVDGICVISDILNQEDCKKRTEELVEKFSNL
ncbi:hydroxyethylthiazole kinase [Gemella sp. zg-570]|uniref:hydroxyethylthiazole kinase n=1 Tax=Gemella sp. zg-570 TaxID=2840371 RepID=UPI001C0E423A|nr:hydroxyethylthiazole kinase [Gemella sp. zg-570]QWQ38932.1 hydroxyethylthiazole kinase [Gemella sp. zg-570]